MTAQAKGPEQLLRALSLPCRPGPWPRARRLPLAELEPPAGAALAVLLPLLHPAVAGEEPAVPQCAFGRRVELDQRPGHAQDDGPGLGGRAAAGAAGEHVHLAAGVRDFQRAE